MNCTLRGVHPVVWSAVNEATGAAETDAPNSIRANARTLVRFGAFIRFISVMVPMIEKRLINVPFKVHAP